jgi:predicted ATP-dependent Lon-type protease
LFVTPPEEHQGRSRRYRRSKFGRFHRNDHNPVAVVEIAIEKGASSILMPISSRRQLNDLPDDLAAKITIHYYLDARDALLKALAI